MNDKSGTFYFISIILLALIISFAYSHLNPDDEYIFYTYAKNISQGKGYSFNQGERINATTSPLYTLLVSSLSYITGPDNYKKIPVIGKLVSLFSLLFLIFFAFLIMKGSGLRLAGYLFALLILVNPYLKNSAGMETQFALMLAMATIYFYVKNRFELTAIVAALAVLARYDNALLIIVIIIHYRFIHKKLPNPAAFLLFSVILLPWFIFSYFYFKSILPTTLWIKIQQHTLGYWGKGFIFLKGFLTSAPGGIFISLILLGIFVVCLSYVFVRRKQILRENFFAIIVIWWVLYFISYGFVLNPPGYPWYYTIFIIPFGMIVSVSLDILLSGFSRNIVLIAFALIFLTGLVLPLKILEYPVINKYNTYFHTAIYLNKYKTNSTVLIDEIGIFGFYFNSGKVIDLLGLINPEIVAYLKQKDYKGIINKYHPDFVVTDYPQTPPYENFTKEKQFLNLYDSVSIISYNNKSVKIYSRE